MTESKIFDVWSDKKSKALANIGDGDGSNSYYNVLPDEIELTTTKNKSKNKRKRTTRDDHDHHQIEEGFLPNLQIMRTVHIATTTHEVNPASSTTMPDFGGRKKNQAAGSLSSD